MSQFPFFSISGIVVDAVYLIISFKEDVIVTADESCVGVADSGCGSQIAAVIVGQYLLLSHYIRKSLEYGYIHCRSGKLYGQGIFSSLGKSTAM